MERAEVHGAEAAHQLATQQLARLPDAAGLPDAARLPEDLPWVLPAAPARATRAAVPATRAAVPAAHRAVPATHAAAGRGRGHRDAQKSTRS